MKKTKNLIRKTIYLFECLIVTFMCRVQIRCDILGALGDKVSELGSKASGFITDIESKITSFSPSAWFNEMIENMLADFLKPLIDILDNFASALTTQTVTFDWFDSYLNGNFTIVMFKTLRYISFVLLVLLFVYYLLQFIKEPESCKVKPLTQIVRTLSSGFFIYLSPFLVKYMVDGFNSVYKNISEIVVGDVVIKENFVESISASIASILGFDMAAFGYGAVSMGGLMGGPIMFGALVTVELLGALLGLLIGLIVFWPLLKQLFRTAIIAFERCIVFIIICLFMPIAIAMKSHPDSENIFNSWVKIVVGQFILLCTSYVFMFFGISGIVLMALGNVNGFVISYIFMLGYFRTAQRFDTYMNDMGFSIASTGTGLAESISQMVKNVGDTLTNGNRLTNGLSMGLKGIGLATASAGLYKAGAAIESTNLRGLSRNGIPGTGAFTSATDKSFAEGIAKMGRGNLQDANGMMAARAIERYMENPRENTSALEAFGYAARAKGMQNLMEAHGIEGTVSAVSPRLNGDIEFSLDGERKNLSRMHSEGAQEIELNGEMAYLSNARSESLKNQMGKGEFVSLDDSNRFDSIRRAGVDIGSFTDDELSTMDSINNDASGPQFGRDGDIIATAHNGEIYRAEPDLDAIRQNIEDSEGAKKKSDQNVDKSDLAQSYMSRFTNAFTEYETSDEDGIRSDNGKLYFEVYKKESGQNGKREKVYISDSCHPLSDMKNVKTTMRKSEGLPRSIINYYMSGKTPKA